MVRAGAIQRERDREAETERRRVKEQRQYEAAVARTRVRIGDRVTVTNGTYRGKAGVVETKRSHLFVVVFDGGGHAQLASTSLRKVAG
ncbi:MAG TPA: hypothetical protein VNZ55_12275 [Thermomicrobiales bacterium]|nr:hypothetical protein [Thermomicrobiales bacterium]